MIILNLSFVVWISPTDGSQPISSSRFGSMQTKIRRSRRKWLKQVCGVRFASHDDVIASPQKKPIICEAELNKVQREITAIWQHLLRGCPVISAGDVINLPKASQRVPSDWETDWLMFALRRLHLNRLRSASHSSARILHLSSCRQFNHQNFSRFLHFTQRKSDFYFIWRLKAFSNASFYELWIKSPVKSRIVAINGYRWHLGETI